MKSSALSKISDLPHTKVKRLAREFLPRDPRAKSRSGYTREYGLNDAFKITLGGHLVAGLRFEVQEAKFIISALHPFLLAHALYPEMDPASGAPEDEKVKEWDVEIIRNPGDEGFELFCLGHIREDMGEGGVRTNFYKKQWIHVSHKPQMQWPQWLEKQTFVVHVLKLSRLREKFLERVRGG